MREYSIYLHLSLTAVPVPVDLGAPATFQILPAVTDAYSVVPTSSNFVINSTGALVIDSGLVLDDSRDYTVSSADFNGTFIVQIIANDGELF